MFFFFFYFQRSQNKWWDHMMLTNKYMILNELNIKTVKWFFVFFFFFFQTFLNLSILTKYEFWIKFVKTKKKPENIYETNTSNQSLISLEVRFFHFIVLESYKHIFSQNKLFLCDGGSPFPRRQSTVIDFRNTESFKRRIDPLVVPSISQSDRRREWQK